MNTPTQAGEWKALEKYTDRQAVPIGVKREDGAWNIIGEAHGHDCHANARRMASAPKLAEALRLIRNNASARKWNCESPDRADADAFYDIEQRAKAALAQWEGGEHA